MSKEIKFCQKKTMKMIDEDDALAYIYDDLMERGIPERFIPTSIFNMFIKEDSYRLTKYKKVKL